MRVYLLLIFLFSSSDINSLYLYDLDHKDEYLESGTKLMDLDFGLHNLESNSSGNEILIAVHGRDSRGFEWIYPLQKIDNKKTITYFFRWDTTKCPQDSVSYFLNELSEIKQIENISKIRILSHSYGGVFSSLLLDRIENIETDIHVIASPLGNRDLKRYCGYTHPKSKNHNVSYFQWRTIQKLDNAFNSFDYDPQIIDFEESSVFRLPANYNGRRLGHLWSISWVAEKIHENELQN